MCIPTVRRDARAGAFPWPPLLSGPSPRNGATANDRACPWACGRAEPHESQFESEQTFDGGAVRGGIASSDSGLTFDRAVRSQDTHRSLSFAALCWAAVGEVVAGHSKCETALNPRWPRRGKAQDTWRPPTIRGCRSGVALCATIQHRWRQASSATTVLRASSATDG